MRFCNTIIKYTSICLTLKNVHGARLGGDIDHSRLRRGITSAADIVEDSEIETDID
jgi:hypothetical protein